MEKFEIQNDQYSFPYHYITSLKNNTPRIERRLKWGLEYLTYTKFVQDFIQNTAKPKSLLDIGCGDGYLINSLPYDNANYFLGIDLSERAIKFANAFSLGYSFKNENLFNIKEKFEVVSLLEVLEHIPDDTIDSFVNEAFDKVADGGYLIISVPTDIMPLNKKHYRHYNTHMLSEQTKRDDFEIVTQEHIFKKSSAWENLTRFIFFSHSKTVRKKLWEIHRKFFFYGNKKNGKHLITIYKKTGD